MLPQEQKRHCHKRKCSPLTMKQWKDAFDEKTGQLIDGGKILRRVRHGGVEANIRSEVWPFLLNFYELESTHGEREAERLVKRQEYENLKRKCKALCENISSKGVTVTKDNLIDMESAYLTSSHDSRILLGTEIVMPSKGILDDCDESLLFEKKINGWSGMNAQDFISWQRTMRLDAVRIADDWVPHSPSQASVTERIAHQLAMVVGLKDDIELEPCMQHHAARLVTILEVYAFYDPETGYCQGMSDLLSPFVALLDEDYIAFWCFTYFMHAVRQNFRMDEKGITWQLQTVSKILKLSDPSLYKHLEKIDAVDCYFIYRMVVILMRRELSFEQTISFWEILWADKAAARLDKVKMSCRKSRGKGPPIDDLLLYVIAAVIRRKRRVIMESCSCMDDVLRECNGMSGKLDVWALLDDARALIASLHHKVPCAALPKPHI